jgi:hypothetical protein
MDNICATFTAPEVEPTGSTLVQLFDVLQVIPYDGLNLDTRIKVGLLDLLCQMGLTSTTRDEWKTKSITNKQWSDIQNFLLHDHEYVSFIPQVETLSMHGQYNSTGDESERVTKMQLDPEYYHNENTLDTMKVVLEMMDALYLSADQNDLTDTIRSFWDKLNKLNKLNKLDLPSKPYSRRAQQIMMIFKVKLEEYGWNMTTESFTKPVEASVLLAEFEKLFTEHHMEPHYINTRVNEFIKDNWTLLLSEIDGGININLAVYHYIQRNNCKPYRWLIYHHTTFFQSMLHKLGWTPAGFLDEPVNIVDLVEDLVRKHLVHTISYSPDLILEDMKHPRIRTTDLGYEIIQGLIDALANTSDFDKAVSEAFEAREIINEMKHDDPMIEYDMERVFVLLSRLGEFTPADVASALMMIV